MLLIASYLGAILPIVWTSLFPYLVTAMGGLILFVAALTPGPSDETWGSMWPLVGYDNAIDALYVRGPWRQRIYELDQQDQKDRITIAMGKWFQQ